MLHNYLTPRPHPTFPEDYDPILDEEDIDPWLEEDDE